MCELLEDRSPLSFTIPTCLTQLQPKSSLQTFHLSSPGDTMRTLNLGKLGLVLAQLESKSRMCSEELLEFLPSRILGRAFVDIFECGGVRFNHRPTEEGKSVSNKYISDLSTLGEVGHPVESARGLG